MGHLDSLKDPNAMPDGLSEKGKAAYHTIMAVLKKHEATDTGGCKSFYSPAEWRERGERYGTESELIVVYDGGDLRRFFNMDAAYSVDCMVAEQYKAQGHPLPEGYKPYASYEGMQAELAKVGVFFEEATGWFAAVYKS
jgi:hypothetical protein